MRHHDDQAVFGDFLKKFHDLNARFGIERARGFVRQNDFRIVDERTSDRHPLHLPSGQLIGFFMYLVFQPHFFQNGKRAGAAFRFVYARNGERKLHVC